MRMEWITVGAKPVVLFLMPPDFSTKPKVRLIVKDGQAQSQSNKTSARSFSNYGKWEVDASYLVWDSDGSGDLRLGFQRLKADQVALPMWTDQVAITAGIGIGATTCQFNSAKPPSRYGSWFIFVNPVTFNYELKQVSSIVGSTITFSVGTTSAWLINSILMPVAFGRFSKRGQFKKLTESIFTIDLTFTEWGDVTQVMNPFVQTLVSTGGNLGRASERLWDIPCTYSQQEVDTTEVDVDYEQIGFGRAEADFAYPQGPRRVTQLDFEAMTRLEIAKIEGIFLDRKGRLNNLWVPTWRADWQVFAPPVIGAPGVTVSANSRYLDSNFIGAGYGFYLLNDNSGHILPFQANTVTTGGTYDVLNFNFGVTSPYNFDPFPKVSALILCRFQNPMIEWTYEADGCADVSIKFLEMTEEYLYTPTQQNVAYCYVFTEANPMATTSWYYTSFESTLVVSGLGTFTPGYFQFTKCQRGTDMGSDEATIESFIFTGNPLQRLFPFIIEAELQVAIYEVNRDSGTHNLLFVGTCDELLTEGAKFTVTCKGFGSIYDQQFHRHMIANECPFVVYSPACGAIMSQHGIVGTIASVVPPQYITIAFGFTPQSQFFNDGVLLIPPGGGQVFQSRLITSMGPGATPFVALDAPLNGSVVGVTVYCYFGCDGINTTCRDLFNNLINFGGEANVPASNPSVVAVQSNDGTSAKK